MYYTACDMIKVISNHGLGSMCTSLQGAVADGVAENLRTTKIPCRLRTLQTNDASTINTPGRSETILGLNSPTDTPWGVRLSDVQMS